MKHKKIVSAVLAMSMLVSSASNLMFPVLATTESDIEISTEISTDDIVIESEADDEIVISEIESDVAVEDDTMSDTEIEMDVVETEQSTEQTETTETTETDSDISISNTESTEDVEITGSEDINTESSEDTESNTDDVNVETKVLLNASVSKNDEKNTLNTGVESVLTVKAENNSDKMSVFKVYFTNVSDELSDDISELESYLTQPALSMQVKGLDKDCNLSVVVTDANGDTQDVTLSFLKETKDGEIVSRYARMELPAGTSTEFDLTVSSDKNSTVTLIPVMEQDEAVYGENASVTWKKKLTFFEKFIYFFTGEEDEEEIEIEDVQGIEMDVTGMDDTDFASMRLVILTNDDSVITDTDNVIGTYGNIYLLQFGSVQETKNAYIKYKDKVDAIEPDKAIEQATESTEITVTEETTESVSEDASVSDVEDTSEDDKFKTAGEYDETQNPLNTLSDVEGSATVQSEQGVIALIDTGANEHVNVIDRVSVIDDVLVGSNAHGDTMVEAIVSQNPNAKILSIRALDDNGFGTISSLVAAMEYAIEQDVDYINLSLYARTTLTTSVLKQEIAKAIEAGIVVIGAAGNDGVDVKDYVPGSVEEAYIIGSATTDGFRQVLSNYGDTVDYNVVAESTSEATALFTGYISANGLESVKDVLNQGLIYATDFDDVGVIIDASKDEDFSKYTLDTEKSVIVRYTFVDSDKLLDDATVDSTFRGKLDDYVDMMFGTMITVADVYDVGNGTYKFKANAPLLMGYVEGNKYQDAIFADGNDNGEVITDGASIDLSTGIVTVDKSHMVSDDGDFCDMQVQVLVPINKIPSVTQVITIENADGSTYNVARSLDGLKNVIIPLNVTGVDETLTSDDFEVYVNNEKQPRAAFWMEDTHSIMLKRDRAAIIYSIRIVVKEHVDSVFSVAGIGDIDYSAAAVFYLKEGTDVSGLYVGQTSTGVSAIGHGGWGAGGYSGTDALNDYGVEGVIGEAYSESQDSLDISNLKMGKFGTPRSLFGIDFSAYRADGTAYQPWKRNGVEYNPAIEGKCNHISASTESQPNTMNMAYKIVDIWAGSDGCTYMAISCIGDTGFAPGGSANKKQTMGGIFNIAVKSGKKASFTANKVWSDNNDSMGVRPDSVDVSLVRNDGTTVGTATLSADNSWTHTWTDIPTQESGTTYTYKLVEDTVADYTVSYSGTDGAFSGDDTNGYTATVTNTLDTGFIRVKKESTMPEITDDNGCYSLANAKFGVYKEQACATKVGDLTTTTTGYSNALEVLPGDYWIKELEAPMGFELNDTPVKVTVTADSTADAPDEGTVKNEPGNDPMAIQITKIWNGPKTDTVPSLEGTQFTVKYYPGYYDTAAQVSALTPKRVWVIEVKKSSSGKFITGLSETYLVDDLSDDLYYVDGYVSIPLGTVTIQETKAAPGYTLDGEFMDANRNTFSPKDVYVTQVKDVNSMVKVQGGNEYSAEDDPKPATIRIKKVDSKGNALSGVEFTITDQDGNAVTDMSGDAISTVTTDASGIAEFSNLYSDIYLITETKTVSGQQLLKEPITVYAPMRMTQQEATDNNLDTTKAHWDESENCYLIFEQTFEVSNTVTFDMPMSGSTFDSRMMIPLGFGMVLLTGAFVLVFRKKRELM